jgi:hypothetical protein
MVSNMVSQPATTKQMAVKLGANWRLKSPYSQEIACSLASFQSFSLLQLGYSTFLPPVSPHLDCKKVCESAGPSHIFFTKTYGPTPALSLSLPFLLSIFPHHFLFCFLLLTRILIFGEEMHPEKIIPHGGIEHLISG